MSLTAVRVKIPFLCLQIEVAIRQALSSGECVPLKALRLHVASVTVPALPCPRASKGVPARGGQLGGCGANWCSAPHAVAWILWLQIYSLGF